MAGGVHRAAEDATDGHGTVIASLTDPQDGVHTQIIGGLFFIQFAHFHHIGAVDQHNDLGEIGFGVFYQFDFRVGKLQIMLAGIGVAVHIVHLDILTFRPGTGEGDDGHVAVAGIAAQHAGREIRRQDFRGNTFIGSRHTLVHLIALSFQAACQGGQGNAVGARTARAGTAAAGHQVEGTIAQQGELVFILRQGQRAVFVLEQHHAFFGQLDIQFSRSLTHFSLRSVVRIEIAFRVFPDRIFRQRGGGKPHAHHKQESNCFFQVFPDFHCFSSSQKC